MSGVALASHLRNAGLRGVRRVTGVLGPARALVEAVLACEDEAPVLLVVPDERRLAETTSDLASFLSWIGKPRPVLPFPALDTDPYRGLSAHSDVAARRARALAALLEGASVAVVAEARALLVRTTAPSLLRTAVLSVSRGENVGLDKIVRVLTTGGYLHEDPVVAPGDYARRGGIVDVFPTDAEEPLRLELLGDAIEEIRTFDPESQRMRRELASVRVPPAREWIVSEAHRARLSEVLVELRKDERLVEKLGRESFPPGVSFSLPLLPDFRASLFDYVGSARILVEEPVDVERAIIAEWDHVLSSYAEASGRFSPPGLAPGDLLLAPDEVLERLSAGASVAEMDVLGEDSGALHVGSQLLPSFRGNVSEFIEALKRELRAGRRATAFVASRGLAERFVEILQEEGLSAGLRDDGDESELPRGAVALRVGSLTHGFTLPAFEEALFSGRDVFAEQPAKERRPVSKLGRFLSDFRDLKVGDYVVHMEHGIGVFTGLKQMGSADAASEFVVLEYQGGDRLYVPVERLDLLEKFRSAESGSPRLDKLGGTGWERVKSRVKKSMRDMAQELLQLYAARKSLRGHAFAADTHWQAEFEDQFEFEETPDQAQAILDLKRDMESPVPMDRLVCGDVGYGKTEVAMRAAFKAVMEGKQVAVLVPTTVLAFQHLSTFRARFAPFPVRVEMISRFRPPKEQKAVLKDLAEGAVDLIIGTHRLLSKDVAFKDLALLIVDEEQRFGVAHKERMKQLKKKVDCVTMTATPIPRTLHMSLAGIRDMSVIETPPKDRMAIQTYLTRFDGKILAEAIRHEIVRGGQVYFVHNRVESIYSMASYLSRLVPEARFGVAHGQMKEDELEKTMLRFIGQEFDVLVSTTIIENGLDIPLVNTLIVNRADRFGLAQLYQLRGRVGRSSRRAYAYLLVPEDHRLTPIARRRLAAIREFSDLGAGFRIAALDLELRGAGNLLGGEQHGHIDAVGFDLYCKLLEQTVRELSGDAEAEPVRPSFNLKMDLRIPEAYIEDVNQRMSIYKRASSARDETELTKLADELRDRYGPLVSPVLQLLEYARLRLLAEKLRVVSVDKEGSTLAVRFDPGATVDPERLVSLASRVKGARFTPAGVFQLPLSDGGPQEVLSAVKEFMLELGAGPRVGAPR